MKKMSGSTDVVNVKTAYVKKFRDSLGDLLGEEKVLLPGSATLADYKKNGHGDLEEGLRTTMRLGDVEILGRPEDAPKEVAVDEDYAYGPPSLGF